MKRIQRQFAAVLSLVIVAIPLVAFMPWSGTGEQEGILIAVCYNKHTRKKQIAQSDNTAKRG